MGNTGKVHFLVGNLVPPTEACANPDIAVVVTTQCLQEREDLRHSYTEVLA